MIHLNYKISIKYCDSNRLKGNQTRPARTKALKLKAFALTGRLCCIYSKTQGAALG